MRLFLQRLHDLQRSTPYVQYPIYTRRQKAHLVSIYFDECLELSPNYPNPRNCLSPSQKTKRFPISQKPAKAASPWCDGLTTPSRYPCLSKTSAPPSPRFPPYQTRFGEGLPTRASRDWRLAPENPCDKHVQYHGASGAGKSELSPNKIKGVRGASEERRKGKIHDKSRPEAHTQTRSHPHSMGPYPQTLAHLCCQKEISLITMAWTRLRSAIIIA